MWLAPSTWPLRSIRCTTSLHQVLSAISPEEAFLGSLSAALGDREWEAAIWIPILLRSALSGRRGLLPGLEHTATRSRKLPELWKVSGVYLLSTQGDRPSHKCSDLRRSICSYGSSLEIPMAGGRKFVVGFGST